MKTNATLLSITLLALIGAAHAAAPAEKFPDRPMRLIVPYPAGGPNDVLARMVGGRLTDNLQQQVVVDNRPGAGGNLAAELAARAVPDGYTMILPAMAYAVNPTLYSKVPYRFDEFTTVTIVAKGPLVLVAAPQLGISTVKELLAAAKAKPGQLQYASGGNGSSLHLAGELFKYLAGVDLLHIPYKGTNDFIPDLLAGRVPLSFSSPLVMRQHVQAGRLKALAVTSIKRSAGWPDVPTIAEGGVKGYEMDAWYTILVPSGTPKNVVADLNRHVVAAIRSGDVPEKLTGLGMEPVGNTPEAAAAYISAEEAKWSKVLKAAGIKAD
jgi:tripartite-type tricarboxylate transporter receptor subunit TctC